MNGYSPTSALALVEFDYQFSAIELEPWRSSGRSLNNGACVETAIAIVGDQAYSLVRDSKNRSNGWLKLTFEEWWHICDKAQRGSFAYCDRGRPVTIELNADRRFVCTMVTRDREDFYDWRLYVNGLQQGPTLEFTGAEIDAWTGDLDLLDARHGTTRGVYMHSQAALTALRLATAA